MAKILVIGGSLGGLFIANMLLRQGHDITLLEKATGSLDGRGAGIVTHDSLAQALRAAGVTVDETLGVAVTKRSKSRGNRVSANSDLMESSLSHAQRKFSKRILSARQNSKDCESK